MKIQQFLLGLFLLLLTSCGDMATNPIPQAAAIAQAIATTQAQTEDATSTVEPTETAVETQVEPPPTASPTSALSTLLDVGLTPIATMAPVTIEPTPTVTLIPPVVVQTAVPTAAPVSDAGKTAVQHYEDAFAYMEQEQWDNAIVELDAAIGLEPEISILYQTLGYAYANKGDFEAALLNLEKYLELEPEAEDRADVEADIQQLRELLASPPSPQFDVPPGKALFVFVNYTDVDWNVDIGPYFLQVPARGPDQAEVVSTIDIDPGTYRWQAHSPGGNYYITDENNNHSFEFTVAEGEVYLQGAGGPPR